MRSQAQAPAPRPDARATVINMRLRTRCRMRIQSLLGPEYSTPERTHPGPLPASGQPQRLLQKRQAGGATTHGMNACPNMRARAYMRFEQVSRGRRDQASSIRLGLGTNRCERGITVQSTAGDGITYGTTGGSLYGSGRYVRSRSQTNTDEHRTSRTSVCRLAGINDRMRSGTAPPIAGTVFWRDARPSTFPIERAATPRCDWRNAE